MIRDGFQTLGIMVGLLAVGGVGAGITVNAIRIQKGLDDGARETRLDMAGDGNGIDRRNRGNPRVPARAPGQGVPAATRPALPIAPAQVPEHSLRVHGGGAGGDVQTHTRRTFVVTAYCPCKKCCGPRACGITASGAPVSANHGLFVAADRTIPFGTRISIPGYANGDGVPVLDRGGAIRQGRLDVYFPTHQAALNWGRKTLTCEVMR